MAYWTTNVVFQFRKTTFNIQSALFNNAQFRKPKKKPPFHRSPQRLPNSSSSLDIAGTPSSTSSARRFSSTISIFLAFAIRDQTTANKIASNFATWTIKYSKSRKNGSRIRSLSHSILRKETDLKSSQKFLNSFWATNAIYSTKILLKNFHNSFLFL